MLLNGAGVEFSPVLVAALRSASRVMALTGAGVSAESGVPTFRQAQTGLWARFDPQELATPQAFEHDPKLVWEWYAWRRGLVEAAQPNPGHYALAALERRVPEFNLVTQNVDGLHKRAGSRTIIELHGSLLHARCLSAGHIFAWSANADLPLRCPQCGGLARPDVVWFGESLPAPAIQAALEAVQSCQVCLVIGTSGLVHPAASLPHLARQHRARLVEINPDHTPLSPHADDVLTGPAGVILPELLRVVWGETIEKENS